MVSALAMNSDQIVLVVLAMFWLVLFIFSRRFRWDERTYEQFKDSRIIWFWLDVFSVPKTRENCLRFSFVCGLQCSCCCQSSLLPLCVPVAERLMAMPDKPSNQSLEPTAGRCKVRI